MNTLFLRNRHLLAMSIVLLLAAALSAMVGLPRIEDPRIGSVPLRHGEHGALVQLADIAQVTRTWRDPPREVALADGERAVFVAARTGPSVHTAQWAAAARRVLEELAELHRGDAIGLSLVFDQSRYTGERLSALSGNLLAGAAVVMLVVWLAMGWRAALIVGSALPLSAGAALFGLGLAGQQIHQVSIFGLIIAIGLLIDNAIVVTDEVRRRRRAGRSPETGHGRGRYAPERATVRLHADHHPRLHAGIPAAGQRRLFRQPHCHQRGAGPGRVVRDVDDCDRRVGGTLRRRSLPKEFTAPWSSFRPLPHTVVKREKPSTTRRSRVRRVVLGLFGAQTAVWPKR